MPPNQQLMRPMIPPIEFLDQHLDVFQASSYDLQEDCFVIESGPPEKTDLDLFCVKGIVDGLVENKVIPSHPDGCLALNSRADINIAVQFFFSAEIACRPSGNVWPLTAAL